jgi:hypothetical protein
VHARQVCRDLPCYADNPLPFKSLDLLARHTDTLLHTNYPPALLELMDALCVEHEAAFKAAYGPDNSVIAVHLVTHYPEDTE